MLRPFSANTSPSTPDRFLPLFVSPSYNPRRQCPCPQHKTRSLRNPELHRCRRHGRGLSRPRHAPRPRSRYQSASRPSFLRCQPEGPFRTRSQSISALNHPISAPSTTSARKTAPTTWSWNSSKANPSTIAAKRPPPSRPGPENRPRDR